MSKAISKSYLSTQLLAMKGKLDVIYGEAIKANADAIEVLDGSESVDGSVAKAVKDGINDFATKVSDDSTVNTFKELVDYAASHNSEYATLAGEVQGNATAIETLNGSGAGSVSKAVADAKGEIEKTIGDLGENTTVAAAIEAAKQAAVDATTVEWETENIDFDTLFA